MHLVPGNHDVGDKRVDWMPADQVCGDYLDIYRGAFGADYHAFDRENLRFVFLNSLLLNSGLPQEQAQKQWFEAQMDGADDKRVFLFMHYPRSSTRRTSAATTTTWTNRPGAGCWRR